METLRILVVDDEAGMRLAVTRALRDCRVALPELDVEVAFAVDAAESGEEALERIAHAPPDLLLLDHKMPGLSGLEVLDELAKRHLDLLVVMITAYATIETAVTATQRGAFDFLAKPFTPDELRGVLTKASSRLLLARQARRLADEKKIPVYVFVDCDPYGIANIYRTLKVGSGNAAHINQFFCVPHAHFLGVTPQDIGTALRVLIGGDDEVTRFRDEKTSEDYDVQLRLEERDRSDASSLPRLLVPGSGGRVVERADMTRTVSVPGGVRSKSGGELGASRAVCHGVVATGWAT